MDLIPGSRVCGVSKDDPVNLGDALLPGTGPGLSFETA
jgi:hypothetical protein